MRTLGVRGLDFIILLNDNAICEGLSRFAQADSGGRWRFHEDLPIYYEEVPALPGNHWNAHERD
jgi:hypothetical protein